MNRGEAEDSINFLFQLTKGENLFQIGWEQRLRALRGQQQKSFPVFSVFFKGTNSLYF